MRRTPHQPPLLRGVVSLAFALLVLASLNAHAASYRLNVGDLVSIQVYGEADLSLETRIGDTGTISYPLLGELTLAGLTVNEAEGLITTGLKGPYLVDPAVTIAIREYRLTIPATSSTPVGPAASPD